MWISGGKTALSRDNGKCKGPEAGASLEGLSKAKMLPLLHSPKHYHLPASPTPHLARPWGMPGGALTRIYHEADAVNGD